jgi:hypothetical protein
VTAEGPGAEPDVGDEALHPEGVGDGLDVLLSMSAEPLSPEDEADEASARVIVQHDVTTTRRTASASAVESSVAAAAPASPRVAPSPGSPHLAPGEAAPTWGPRDHPPPVQAPPPPHPMDAPRASRPTEAPDMPSAPLTARRTAPPGPSTPAGPATTERPVPERPSHPRVRRWFGRGSGDGARNGEDPPTTEVAEGAGAAPPAAPALDPPTAPLVDAIEPIVPPEPDLGPGDVDPWNLELAVARLSAGARRTGAVALGVLSTVLVEGERVEVVVQGVYQHHAGVVALTGGRVIVVNGRHWVPDVRVLPISAELVVQGWQDERQAALTFAEAGRSVVMSGIADRPLAQDLARRVRELVAGVGGPAS